MSYAVGLANFLEHRGIPVEFLAAGVNDHRSQKFKVTTVVPPGSDELQFARALTRYLARHAFSEDTVFVANTELYAWAFRHVKPTPPLVLVMHGPAYPALKGRRPIAGRAFVRVVEPKAVRLAHIVVAIDMESMEYVSAKYPHVPVIQIPIPVDVDHFRPVDRRESRRRWGIGNEPVVLLVGRLAPEKDPRFALEIHRRVLTSHPHAKLMIAGNGPLASRVSTEGALLGGGVLRMLGVVPRQDLPSLYTAADALLISSRIEQLPNALLESLACGTQVFSTPVGDVPTIIVDERLGRIIPRDPAEAASLLAKGIPENDSAREKYSPLRRATACRFSWDRTGPRLVEVFDASLTS